MARRSDHTREELRELMISSAREIIADKGLIGLTAREVAGKIGYSAGTIYNVFSNLDEIVFHLEAEVLESLELILCEISEDIPPEIQLQEFVMKYLDFIDTQFNSWQLLIEHKTPLELEMPEWYEEKFESIIKLVEDKVRLILSTKDDASIRRAARVFWAGLHGVILLSAGEKLSVTDITNRKDYAGFWGRVYVEGLKAMNARPCQHPATATQMRPAAGTK